MSGLFETLCNGQEINEFIELSAVDRELSDENLLIFVQNLKLCSKSTYSQNRRFEEKAHAECILMGHSDVNERVYPYVHDGDARFSRIALKMILFKKVVPEYCSKSHLMCVCYS